MHFFRRVACAAAKVTSLLTTSLLTLTLPCNSADWFGELQLAERQLTQGKLSDGMESYARALKLAESAHVDCKNARFIELMAVGNEISVRGAKVPEQTAATLRLKEHAAVAICGSDSPAAIESQQMMFTFYNMIRNRALAETYKKKFATPANMAKFQEVEVFREAGAKRVNAFMNKSAP